MPRIISQKISVQIIFILLIGVFHTISLSQPKDSLITEVENGLLPYVLIEGESSFNLQDRMRYHKVPGLSITVIKDYKIDLNRDVNEQLISWKIPENEFTKQGTVTPLLLMNHSGGAMFSPGVAYLADNFPTNLQILNGESPSKTKAVVIDKIPGTEYQYSNSGYAILQQLTVDKTGEASFPEITKVKIFQPLDMKSTTFLQPLPEELIKIAAAGHMANGLPLEVKRYFFPHMAAGGLWTTTADYAKYIIELQKSYLGKSNKIISRKLAIEMLSPHVS